MEEITIQVEENRELLTIKNNALLLAITMNEDYKKIVENLCRESDSNDIKRLESDIKKLKSDIKGYANES